MDFWKVYIKDYIFTTPSNICDRAFYEITKFFFCTFFTYRKSRPQRDWSQQGGNSAQYSGIFKYNKHLQGLSRLIQVHSEACLLPVYSEAWYIQDPGIFSTLEYSEPCYLQNPGIQNPSIFRSLRYSKSWFIQNPGIFRTRTIFRSLVY